MNKEIYDLIIAVSIKRPKGKSNAIFKHLVEKYYQIYYYYEKLHDYNMIKCELCHLRAIYKGIHGSAFCGNHIIDYKDQMDNAFIKSKIKPGDCENFKLYLIKRYRKEYK